MTARGRLPSRTGKALSPICATNQGDGAVGVREEAAQERSESEELMAQVYADLRFSPHDTAFLTDAIIIAVVRAT